VNPDDLPDEIVQPLLRLGRALVTHARAHRDTNLAEHEDGVLSAWRMVAPALLESVLGLATTGLEMTARPLASRCPRCEQRRGVQSQRQRQVQTRLGPIRLKRWWHHCWKCGHGWSPPDQTMWLFDSAGALKHIEDRNTNQSNLTYDANGNLTSVSDPAGRGLLTLAYNTCHSGRLCSVTDWQARTVSYSYDSNGRLQTVSDRTGNQTTYAYDGTTTAHLTTISDANSNVQVTNHYDTTGRVDWQKDAQGIQTGQQTTMTYDTTSACTSPTPPNPAVCTNTVSYPTTSFDNSNPSVADTFAGAQLSQRVTKPSSGETPLTEAFGYKANGFRNLVSDARGNTTSFCYDVDYAGTTIGGSRGNLTRRIDPIVNGSHPVSLFKFDATQDVLQTSGVRPSR
jgi:YD repeat-containing protein